MPGCFTFPEGSHRTLLLGENCKKCFYYSQTENFSFLTQSTQFSWNCRVQVTRVRILQGHPSSASKKQLYKYQNSAWRRSFFLSHHPSKRLIRSIMAHFFTEFYDLSATDISNISISCLWSWKHHLLGFWQRYRKIELLKKKKPQRTFQEIPVSIFHLLSLPLCKNLHRLKNMENWHGWWHFIKPHSILKSKQGKKATEHDADKLISCFQ